MIYEFGDYKVKSARIKDTFWTIGGGFKGYVFYKEELINDLIYSRSEAFVISWAAEEIERHKRNIALLEKVATS